MSFYESSKLAWKAYGTKDHLIVDTNDWPMGVTMGLHLAYSVKDDMDYKMGDITHYTLDGTIYYSFYATRKQMLKCMFFQFFNKSKYQKEVETMGKMEVVLE